MSLMNDAVKTEETRCTCCREPIAGIHWCVYLTAPSKTRVARICGLCRAHQIENLATWSRATGGQAAWHRAFVGGQGVQQSSGRRVEYGGCPE